jgi:hypothetical protein
MARRLSARPNWRRWHSLRWPSTITATSRRSRPAVMSSYSPTRMGLATTNVGSRERLLRWVAASGEPGGLRDRGAFGNDPQPLITMMIPNSSLPERNVLLGGNEFELPVLQWRTGEIEAADDVFQSLCSWHMRCGRKSLLQPRGRYRLVVKSGAHD